MPTGALPIKTVCRRPLVLTLTTLLAVVSLLAITLGVLSAFPACATLRGYFEGALFANLVPKAGEQVRLYLASFARNTD